MREHRGPEARIRDAAQQWWRVTSRLPDTLEKLDRAADAVRDYPLGQTRKAERRGVPGWLFGAVLGVAAGAGALWAALALA